MAATYMDAYDDPAPPATPRQQQEPILMPVSMEESMRRAQEVVLARHYEEEDPLDRRRAAAPRPTSLIAALTSSPSQQQQNGEVSPIRFSRSRRPREEDDDGSADGLDHATLRNVRASLARSFARAEPPPEPQHQQQQQAFEVRCIACEIGNDINDRLCNAFTTITNFYNRQRFEMDSTELYRQIQLYYTSEIRKKARENHRRELPPMSTEMWRLHLTAHRYDPVAKLVDETAKISHAMDNLMNRIMMQAAGNSADEMVDADVVRTLRDLKSMRDGSFLLIDRLQRSRGGERARSTGRGK